MSIHLIMDALTRAQPAVLFLSTTATSEPMRVWCDTIAAQMPGIPVRVIPIDDPAAEQRAAELRREQLDQALHGFKLKTPEQLRSLRAVRQYESRVNDESCHCGEPIYFAEDGFTRYLCQRCTDVRCDVDPQACKGEL